ASGACRAVLLLCAPEASRRQVVDTVPKRPAPRDTVVDADTLPVHITITDPRHLLDWTAGSPPAIHAPGWYALLQRSHPRRAPATFEPLLSPLALHERLRPHPYQLRVVERVLREMAPAAILADEVGLGKTVEAGLIYKELALRGLAESALVLAPKALLGQW